MMTESVSVLKDLEISRKIVLKALHHVKKYSLKTENISNPGFIALQSSLEETCQEIKDVLLDSDYDRAKPKKNPLCCMEIYHGTKRVTPQWVIDNKERQNRKNGIEPWQFPESEIEYKEIWRGCRGYRMKGIIYCYPHKVQRINTIRQAATLIQSFARRNRAKKLVDNMKKFFSDGKDDDVRQIILGYLRE